MSEPGPGREPLDLDEALAAIEERYPERTVQSLMPPWDDETATYSAWVTRGFDPWTREAGAGNVYVAIDQFSGEVVYDGTPGEGQRVRPGVGRLVVPAAHRRLRRHADPLPVDRARPDAGRPRRHGPARCT